MRDEGPGEGVDQVLRDGGRRRGGGYDVAVQCNAKITLKEFVTKV